MGDLTEHFSKWEFKCPCSECKKKKIHIDLNLVYKLEEIRDLIGGKPIDITSGIRCKTENKKVGGYSDSPHLLKKAADIQVKGMTPIEVALTSSDGEYPYEGIRNIRMGIYPNHLHIDVIPANPSKFWLVKKYGQAPIYSGDERELQNFLRKENVI